MGGEAKGIVFGLCMLLGLRASAATFPYPGPEEKKAVFAAVREVGAISRRASSLDQLGRESLSQSRAVLDIGAPAVYTLSLCLDDSDWKVRFWISDILGYLGNADARRPLLRVLENGEEDPRVRRQALRSLRRLKVDVDEGKIKNVRW